MEYSQKTADLIERMCKNVEREDFVLDKEKSEELILKTYDLFGLQRPNKIKWCVDIFDVEFARSARSAMSARSTMTAKSAISARSAWSTRSLMSAKSAMSAMSTMSTRSAMAARSANSAIFAMSAMSEWYAWSAWSALDYDFDLYIFEFEYCENLDVNNPVKQNDVIYLEYCELLMQAKEAGLGYMLEVDDCLYLAPTPLIKINSRNQYHSTSQPAIKWKDGKEFWFYNGVAVNEKIILRPEELTLKNIKDEPNEEVKRVMIERMGERFTELAQPKILQEDKFGKLVEIQFENLIMLYANVVCPSTGREYYLRVPRTLEDSLNMLRVSKGVTWEEWDEENEKAIWSNSGVMETCQQAVAWTFGVKAEDFVPIYET